MSHQAALDSVLALPWLSDAIKRTLLPEYVAEGLPSQILALEELGRWKSQAPGAVIDLSTGAQIPSLPSEQVRARAQAAIDDGGYLKNWLPLRVGLADYLKRERGLTVDPGTEILVTVGGQLAIEATCRVLLNPGDDVLLIDPDYASFEPIIRMHGANVIPVPLGRDQNGEWHLDLDALEARLTSRTRLLIMSSPNNPTGLVYSRDELNTLGEIAERHNFYIFSDEIWSDLVLPGYSFVSLAALPSARARTITGFSFSKAYAMSGYRIGAVIAPPELIRFMSIVVRLAVQAAGTHDQVAALAALEQPLDWLNDKIKQFDELVRYAVERLNGMPGVRCSLPQSAYFAFPDIRGTGLSSLEFARRALLEEAVMVLPGVLFGRNGEGHLRLSCCLPREQLVEGLTRLERIVRRATEAAQPHIHQFQGTQ